jgi:hypothetical protein
MASPICVYCIPRLKLPAIWQDIILAGVHPV